MGRWGRGLWAVMVLAPLAGWSVAGPVPVLADDPECTITGTEGDDVLLGTGGSDVICGRGGNDTISGGGEDDIIYAGPGDDVINGGSGNDIIYGEDGNDQIEGGSGDDVIWGGSGHDVLEGGSRNDVIYGEEGNDEIDGGSGDDDLRGGPGADLAAGGGGVDVCAAEGTTSCETVLADDDEPLPTAVEMVAPGAGELVFSTTVVTVAVSPVDAVGTVDLLADGQVVDTAPIQEGSAGLVWDTTTVGEGQHTLTVDARDGGGVVTASVSTGVVVVNEFDAAGRLLADFEAGRIDVSRYVELGLTGLLAPELLADRYRAGGEGDGEANGLVIEYLQYWEDLDEDTQERLGAAIEAARLLDFEYVAELLGTDVLGGEQPAGLQSVKPAAVADWPECSETHLSGKGGDVTYVRCTHQTDRFTISYLPASASIEDGVAEVDRLLRSGTSLVDCDPIDFGNCNRVPDYVDRVAAALEHGWDVYEDLGFEMPPIPAKVTIEADRPHVFPTLGGLWEPTIVVNNLNNQFSTSRHELFHLVQYEYVALIQIPGQLGVWAWLEATAEWAAHQGVRPSDNVGVAQEEQDSEYYQRIGAVLSRPNWWALTFEDQIPLANPFREQRRQYGMFILAEHLEQHLDQPDPFTTVVERTWEKIGAGASTPTAIAEVVAEHSPEGWSLADQLADFHLDSFVLTQQDGLGFSDPDVDAWKVALSEPPPPIEALVQERPLSVDHDFDAVGEVWDPTEAERPFVVAGGSVYAVMDLVDPAGEALVADLVVEVPAIDELGVSLLLFDGYPNLCPVQPPSIRIDSGPGTVAEVRVLLGGACDEAVLVISHTGLVPGLFGELEPGFFGNGVRVDWQAGLEESDVGPNLGFETGTLAGWTIVDSGDGTPGVDPVVEVVSPGLVGDHAARITTGSDPEDGLSTVVDPGIGACEMTALAAGNPGTIAVMEVVHDASGFLRRTAYTFTGDESGPITLSVTTPSSSFPPADVTVRLLYGGTSSTPAVIIFDELAVLYCL